MGEPACLRRSFSHPSSASRETKEGDPLRALTESISFGRFMSESLAWEKWSTFSHNRYLEEVEQFSKPGSVAQMKAYFEAHYKMRAAMKASTLLEQPNVVANNVSEAEPNSTGHNDSASDNESAKATSCNEQQDTSLIEANCPNNQRVNAENEQVERSEKCAELNGVVESPTEVKKINQLEIAQNSDKITPTSEYKLPEKKTAEKENLAAVPTNKRRMNSSGKSSNHSKASKLPKPSTSHVSSLQPRAGEIVSQSSKNSAGDLFHKKGATPTSVRMSINFGSSSGQNRKSSLRMSRESRSTQQNPTKTSVSEVSKIIPSAVRPSEDRRKKSLLNKSVSATTLASTILQALGGDRIKSPSASGSKTRTPLTPSPFNLRCEERAARRKEFFKKLEEKNNAREAEQMPPQVRLKFDHPQEKADNDIEKRKTRTDFRSKPSDNLQSGLQSPSTQNKKLPLPRPRSPKFGRKPASDVVQEKGFRLLRRPAANAEKSDLPTKSSQSMARSITLISKKKAHENASPNIER
ncbi:hypothetical protein K2173_002658 [Erythroxylum novogranatense]|uniref:TPX2 C-terminal domain-containing protein n=1 Tax=Erythroxylum novogranatense TaxID=1862640 RepID=A0AAV8SY78_9ROSI|nr:hypothetical protein K2173_002658 [Erythroxylum novogranatense]